MESRPANDYDWFRESFVSAVDAIDASLKGKRHTVAVVVAAVIAGGHILIEDIPGTGKSLLAQKLADVTGGSINTMHFSPDLMPGDISGYEVYSQEYQTMEFQRGPLFTNVFLAEALNRAPPRTQSALLSAMESRNVSAGGRLHHLPNPFHVIATQNPLEDQGTYPLPEAQVDRFMVQVSLGYPPPEDELLLLRNPDWAVEDNAGWKPRLNLARMTGIAGTVHVSEAAARYVLTVVEATRRHGAVRRGLSTRAGRTAVQLAQVWAAKDGRDYIVPDDLHAVAVPALAHRIQLTPEGELSGAERGEVIRECLEVSFRAPG